MTEQERHALLARVPADAEVQGGRAVIRGTRIPVARIVAALSAGASFRELRDDYGLPDEDIRAALAYAAKTVDEAEAERAAIIDRLGTYADMVRREFDVESVVLFGSHARGTARTESDIDVAVIVNRLEGEWLSAASRLYTLARDVDLRIEPVILQTGHDRSGFLEHIMRTGEVIYSREAG